MTFLDPLYTITGELVEAVLAKIIVVVVMAHFGNRPCHACAIS